MKQGSYYAKDLATLEAVEQLLPDGLKEGVLASFLGSCYSLQINPLPSLRRLGLNAEYRESTDAVPDLQGGILVAGRLVPLKPGEVAISTGWSLVDDMEWRKYGYVILSPAVTSKQASSENPDRPWRSWAKWDAFHGFQDDCTCDDHRTLEAAEAVCSRLKKDGLGGDRRYFPISTWVEDRRPKQQ